MAGRQVALYFAWSRPDEVAAPLGVLEDRFPALFELRRLFWPRFEKFADPVNFDQGVGGFLDNIQLENFKLFADLAASWTGNPVRRAERRTDAGLRALDARISRRCRYARHHQFRLVADGSNTRAKPRSAPSDRFSTTPTIRFSYAPITTSAMPTNFPRANDWRGRNSNSITMAIPPFRRGSASAISAFRF